VPSIHDDNLKTFQSMKSEAEFEAKAEKMLAGYRSFPNGRDYRCFRERDRMDVNNSEFNSNYDTIFPDSPGSPAWFDRRFSNEW